MCNHHFQLAWLPQAEDGEPDYSQWETITSLPFGNWLAGREGGSAEEQAKAKMVELAEIYALADPERARWLYIQRCDCNGPWDDGDFYPFAENVPTSTESEQRLAQEIIKLREALESYTGIKINQGERLTITLPGSGAEAAEEALWGSQ